MWSSAANRRIPSRTRALICSNTAGEAIGIPRCSRRKYTTPPGVCSFCTNPDRYSRSKHDRSNTVCPSSTSLTVTTREPATLATSRNHAYGRKSEPHPHGPYQAHPPPRRSEAAPL